MKKVIIFGLLSALGLQACGSKAFTNGTYDDPNRVELLDDKFNEADMQQMAQKIVDSILKCPDIVEFKGRPIIAVSKVVNRTEEYPDLDMLTEKIQSELTKSRKVKFSDRASRAEIDDEAAYGESGRVSRETAVKLGQQLGINYLLTGALATNVQQVGNDKFIYYKLNMKLTNTRTATVDCEDEKEIRKKFRKKSLGLF